ncbi:BQ2448_63 [Microbotryum intermedium]|uniref:Enhancer of polycomb-like protein n=1 Tax=Microbotryum intermedium TaxID=269621 RepID=A0A238F1D1_9BASI|nr:BQ2448_63 [Microbotryum intermedium]
MVKSSGRFRNRKLGFKSRISIVLGVDRFDEDPVEDLDFEEDPKGKSVETGVDKDEEGEVHLQAVIAASATAAVASTANSNAATPGGASSSSSSSSGRATKDDQDTNKGGRGDKSSEGHKDNKAYIPTPDAHGAIDNELFYQLYPKGWNDPVTYIRFSDTVEDTTMGATNYTMDEDDEDWLEAYNKRLGLAAQSDSADGSGSGLTPNSRRKGKDKAKAEDSKEDATAATTISEDDFERVMELLEQLADQKAPMAHVDPTFLPSVADMELHISESTEYAQLEPLARPIYPHWKHRRLARNGKAIIPQLDYDESNENNPYVCFRRRELKSSRKTRRSDAQNIERLTRLRNDLFAAHALMLKVRERERLKLEAIELERKVFEVRVEARELKRRLGEADGDEELLVSRRDKKRRKEEVAAANAAGTLRLSLRKPDPSNLNHALLVTSAEDLKARKDRAVAITARMDRDLQKKREADSAWDDHTDGAYVPRAPATPARYWRAVESVQGSTAGLPSSQSNANKVETLGFATQYQPSMGRVRTSFRRRVGRGGRVMLDRIAPTVRTTSLRSANSLHKPLTIKLTFESDVSDVDEEMDEDEEDADLREARLARQAERFRYDSDAHHDFVCADEPVVLDDFDLRHVVKRTGLLKPDDLASLTLDTSYLEQAYQWAATDPDKHAPPPQTFGRPPPRPPPAQPQNSAGLAMQLGAANGGQPFNAVQMAAAQALRAAQQQAQLKRQQQIAPSNDPNNAMRRTPSSGNAASKLGPNGVAQGGQPMQVNWSTADANKLAAAAAASGLVLPPGFPQVHQNGMQQQTFAQQQQQQQQRIANGLLKGANGMNPNNLPTSRAPLSNLQLALQAQQQLVAAQSAAGGGGQSPISMGVAGLNPNSRPNSAASQHLQSPSSLLSQGLPSPSVGGVVRVSSPAAHQYAQQLGLKLSQQQHQQLIPSLPASATSQSSFTGFAT